MVEHGWAWNVRPPVGVITSRKFKVPSAEFVESFVMFLYGSSNMFLEHLAAWGDAWTAQDLEHVSILIMFFGGGLVSLGAPPTEKVFFRLTVIVRHARRVATHSRPSERNHLDRSEHAWSSTSTHRPLGSPPNVPVLLEPFPRAHHPPAGPDDELPPSSLVGLDHDPQAVGHPVRRLRPGPRAHVHPDVHHASPVVPAVAAPDRNRHVVLPHLGRDHFHAEQQGHRGRHGPARFKCHVQLHAHDGFHGVFDGMDNDCVGCQRVGDRKEDATYALSKWGCLETNIYFNEAFQ